MPCESHGKSKKLARPKRFELLTPRFVVWSRHPRKALVAHITQSHVTNARYSHPAPTPPSSDFSAARFSGLPGLSGSSPVRNVGLIASPRPFKPEDDELLMSDIAKFGLVLGEFINDLTQRLPFRDHNQVTFSSVRLTL